MMCSACKLNKQGEKYSLDILLSQFGTSLVFHVQFDLSYPLSLDGELYFLFSLLPFLLSKVCLTFDWMLNVACRKMIRTAITTIFARNRHTAFSVTVLIWDIKSVKHLFGLNCLSLFLPMHSHTHTHTHTHTLKPHYLYTVRLIKY